MGRPGGSSLQELKVCHLLLEECQVIHSSLDNVQRVFCLPLTETYISTAGAEHSVNVLTNPGHARPAGER